MNHFETESRTLRQAEIANVQALSRNPSGFLSGKLEGAPIEFVEAMAAPYLRAARAKPAFEAARLTSPPHIVNVEIDCDGCGGSGFDLGGIDPWGPEPCPACNGAKTQRITRNYLAEAFQIVANPESTRPIERQHLVAGIQHCRQVVSALVSLPEVA